MTETQRDLRLYCEASGCEIWQQILDWEDEHEGERCALRRHCSQDCAAYDFNRWIYSVGKEIEDMQGEGRYR